jgi:hypothetical protein
MLSHLWSMRLTVASVERPGKHFLIGGMWHENENHQKWRFLHLMVPMTYPAEILASEKKLSFTHHCNHMCLRAVAHTHLAESSLDSKFMSLCAFVIPALICDETRETFISSLLLATTCIPTSAPLRIACAGATVWTMWHQLKPSRN